MQTQQPQHPQSPAATCIARALIELPRGTRVVDFERDLAALANRYGCNLQRSNDPRMPLNYELRQLPQQAARA
ncbi:hypothetical protein [uncultured Brevundimonas sp.]|mgnify:CR=1 FL=1|uniref:hypothetical protein n=1 Tax=uncultured Brevundimonas sp. TaxID=213418 RepID=UPI0030EB6C92|tara:strand:- start:3731 stop:3949 length:219 start_codon:yes stop_codon:yes gene_type:complete